MQCQLVPLVPFFAVMGAMLYVVIRNHGRIRDISVRQMVIMAGFSLYFGFTSTGVDNAAHVGGMVLWIYLGGSSLSSGNFFWQNNVEGCFSIGFNFCINVSTVSLDDLSGDCQPQSGSTLFECYKWVKISFSCDSGMPHPLSVMTICTLWSLEKAHNFTFPSALKLLLLHF